MILYGNPGCLIAFDVYNNVLWDINRIRSLKHMRKTEQHALVFLQMKNTFRSLVSSCEIWFLFTFMVKLCILKKLVSFII
jgi:hypothetical protein